VVAVLLAVGTDKGLFLATSEDRRAWSWSGPHAVMARVAAIGLDARQAPLRVLMGGRHEHWGPVVMHSDDLGVTWVEEERAALRFPPDAEAAVAQVWQLQPGPPDRPGEVWAGVEPAALFRSHDGGESFELVRGLWDHPHRATWLPGFGGLCLHTVLPHPTDPDEVLVGISTGGVYRSSDGGKSWAPSNAGIEARFQPDRYPEYGQCVHKVTRDSADPTRLYLQNHGGVFTSHDDGSTWGLATAGLPADFGFGLAAHPYRAGTAFLFPLQADAHRMPPQYRARVYRTDDAGQSWSASGTGLPDEGFYSVVLRDALAVDGVGSLADPDRLGVYFGTRSGEVWASTDAGSTWGQVAQHFPDVLCVRATVLPDAPGVAVS
jgi:hypothetical protein